MSTIVDQQPMVADLGGPHLGAPSSSSARPLPQGTFAARQKVSIVPNGSPPINFLLSISVYTEYISYRTRGGLLGLEADSKFSYVFATGPQRHQLFLLKHYLNYLEFRCETYTQLQSL
ncbi:unnamed protein product [Cuscuta europaea]|uniref:Uncharacterized protein n=1 Tax=Cuscuta europaea TaxID=41803 RepID=A0A9P0Z706_CUSEU|nr:unnamed protein product [Cuscuta europaea]